MTAINPNPRKNQPSKPPADSKEIVSQFMKQLQDEICTGLEGVDGGGKFKEDSWQREEGGGGRSRVLSDGGVLEQGGVNFSEVWGSHYRPRFSSSALKRQDMVFMPQVRRWCYIPVVPTFPRFISTIAILRRACLVVWWRCGSNSLLSFCRRCVSFSSDI